MIYMSVLFLHIHIITCIVIVEIVRVFLALYIKRLICRGFLKYFVNTPDS